MVKTLAQLRQEIAQLSQAGVTDYTTGVADFDTTTFPTATQVNIFINDCIREITSNWDYTFKETNKSYPFLHTISGVQSVDLWTSNRASGTITPYPADVLSFSWSAENSVQDLNNNFSGITYTGLSGTSVFTGVSTSGVQSISDYTTVGLQYQLNEDIDKIVAIGIPHSVTGGTANGILMTGVDWHEMERIIPIGIISSSGSPVFYSEFPGLSPDVNNKTIQFFPSPTPDFSGNTFIVHYLKKHVDMVVDTEKQNIIPEQWQYVITQAVLEKVFDVLDNPKAELATGRKDTLVSAMRQWDGNQPSKMPTWMDYRYNSLTNRTYDNSTVVYLPPN